MATKAWIAKQKRRAALVKKYADVRRQLKKEKNYAALAQLPRDSSPTRSHNRCQLTGRSKAVLRKFKTLQPNQFLASGMGWDRPADAIDPMNSAKNRRVEVKVYPLEATH